MAQFLLGPTGKLLLLNGKPLSLNVAAAPTTALSLTQWQIAAPAGGASRFVIQTTASSADTTGNVPVVFGYTGGAPTSVQARLVDGTTGLPITNFDWTDITSTVTATNGTGLGYLNGVPAGVNYKRQIRLGTNAAITSADTVPFNVGMMLLPWGQSNMTGLLSGGTGSSTYSVPPVPGTSTSEGVYFNGNGDGAFFGPGGFVGGGTTNAYNIGSFYTNGSGALSMIRLIGDTLKSKHGRKIGVALNPNAQNGTAMSTFMTVTNGVPRITFAAANGTANGAIGFSTYATNPYIIANGDYRAVLWHQGETLDWWVSTTPQRAAELKSFCQAHINHVAKFGRQPNQITFLFAMMGVSSATAMEMLRQAVVELLKDSDVIAGGWDVRIGWNCIDLAPPGGSGLHFTDEDQRRGARRMTQALGNVVNPAGVPFGARGPMLTGAYTRSGNDITLTVQHEGGTSLSAKNTGAAITGWFANTVADFTGTNLLVTNVVVSGANQITVTVTMADGSAAPATFYIKHCGNKLGTQNSYFPDVSNLIYDNFAYPSWAVAGDQYVGLPLLPTPYAIKVG